MWSEWLCLHLRALCSCADGGQEYVSVLDESWLVRRKSTAGGRRSEGGARQGYGPSASLMLASFHTLVLRNGSSIVNFFLHRPATLPTTASPKTLHSRQDAYPQGRSQEDPRVSPPPHQSMLRSNRALDFRMKTIHLDLDLLLTSLLLI